MYACLNSKKSALKGHMFQELLYAVQIIVSDLTQNCILICSTVESPGTGNVSCVEGTIYRELNGMHIVTWKQDF